MGRQPADPIVDGHPKARFCPCQDGLDALRVRTAVVATGPGSLVWGGGPEAKCCRKGVWISSRALENPFVLRRQGRGPVHGTLCNGGPVRQSVQNSPPSKCQSGASIPLPYECGPDGRHSSDCGRKATSRAVVCRSCIPTPVARKCPDCLLLFSDLHVVLTHRFPTLWGW